MSYMPDIAAQEKLAIPEPGGLIVQRDLVPRPIVQRANGEVDREHVNNNFLFTEQPIDTFGYATPVSTGGMFGDHYPNLLAMGNIIVPIAMNDYRLLSLYVRVIDERDSLSPHRDKTWDARILIEGNQSKWIINREPWKTAYKGRMPLNQGDGAAINNQLAYDMQLSHGVENTYGARRISYLWIFANGRRVDR